MKKAIAIFILIGTFINPYCWSQSTDSILMNLPSNEVKSIRIYELINAANDLYKSHPDNAIDSITEALNLSYTEKDVTGEAFSYQTLGSIYHYLKRYGKSMDNFQRALKLFKQENRENQVYITTKYLGIVADAGKDYTRAEKFYLDFLGQAKKRADQNAEVFCYEQLGGLYYKTGNYEKAIEYYEKTADKARENNNPQELLMANDNLAQAYLQNKDTENAKQVIEQNIKQAEETNDVQMLRNSYYNMGNYYQQKADPDLSLDYQMKAYELDQKLGNHDRIYNALEIAQIFIDKQEVEKAIPFLQESMQNPSEVSGNSIVQLGGLNRNLLQSKTKAMEMLTSVYAETGNFDEAMQVMERLLYLKDSVIDEKEREAEKAARLNQILSLKEVRIDSLEKFRELDKRELELSTQREELRNQELSYQKNINLMLSIGVVLLLFSGGLVYKSYRDKRRANELLALKSLRTQMNPHFIFNALNAVNGFIASNDERTANKYLADFSKLMRSVLENSDHDLVPIQREIEIVELYAKLEQARFPEKLDFVFEEDIQSDKETLLTPPMFIQPFVENAVWHGLRYREDKGLLKVSVREKGGVIKWEITDNGIGVEGSKKMKTNNQKTHKSIALSNINERIDVINRLFKMNIKVTTTEAFKDEQYPGTMVCIEVPIKRN